MVIGNIIFIMFMFFLIYSFRVVCVYFIIYIIYVYRINRILLSDECINKYGSIILLYGLKLYI